MPSERAMPPDDEEEEQEEQEQQQPPSEKAVAHEPVAARATGVRRPASFAVGAGDNTVAAFHVFIEFLDGSERREGQEDLLRAAVSVEGLIKAQLSESVADYLGPEFGLRGFEIRPGESVELIALIVLLGSATATYGAVRSGLDYVRRDARSIAERLITLPFDHGGLSISAYHELGDAMQQFPTTEERSSARSRAALAEEGSTSEERAPSARPASTPMPGIQSAFLNVIVALVIVVLLSTLLAVVLVEVL